MAIREILQSKVEAYSDVGKLLLLSWSRLEPKAELSKAEVASRHGLTKPQASKAIRSLCAAGVVEPTRRHAGNRPVEVYRLESRFEKKAAHASAGDLVWISNIDDILSRRSELLRSLRYGARLLMLYLWACSDQCGVVRDVTQADIAEATGLSKKSISHLINQLMAQCLIRCVVPGGVPRGSRRKSPEPRKENNVVRLSSVYYLNRAHRAYRSRQCPYVVVMCSGLHVSANRLVELKKLTSGVSKLYRQSYQSELALLERVTYMSSRIMSECRELLINTQKLRARVTVEAKGKDKALTPSYPKLKELETELRQPYVDLLPEIDDEWWRDMTGHTVTFCESIYFAFEKARSELGLSEISEFQLLPVKLREASGSSLIGLGLVLLGYQEGFISNSSRLFKLARGRLEEKEVVDVSDRSADGLDELMRFGVFGIPNSRLPGPGQK